MYYIVYFFLYCFSLLPLFILYRISDLAYVIMYYVIGYRKEVVMSNLSIAFPEKSEKEKVAIAKKFYQNLSDTFLEMIKLMSISEKAFNKLASINLDPAIVLAKKGKSIQFHAGHQFNWELANWLIAAKMPIPFVGVYMKINNPAINKIFFDLRSKKGTVLVSAQEFKNKMHQLLSQQYSLGLAADQNPGNVNNAYWLNFFGKAAPFVTGPDKGALKNNTAVVFVKLIKIKRGQYKFETEVVFEHTTGLKDGDITLKYRDILEDTIRKNPDNYLWSHRRWRWNYEKAAHESRWIDNNPPKV